MPTPFFESTLRDVILSLGDDELVMADTETRREIESEAFLDGLRFPPTLTGHLRAAEYLGRRRGEIRRRRLEQNSRPIVLFPEDIVGAKTRRARLIVVATTQTELQTTAQVASRIPRVDVLSLKNEIHPAVSSAGELDEKFSRLMSSDAPESGALIILTVMRSGSFLLAELASRLGLGRPVEHLKDPIIEALRIRDRRDLSAKVWFRSLEHSQRVHPSGCFGTKLVSHYVRRLRDVLLSTERDWLDGWIGSRKTVTLRREDHVKQAVSAYRAQKTGIYRARTADEEERAKSEEIPYDFEALRERFEFLRSEDQFVEEYANRVVGGARLDLTYESFTEDLSGTINALASFAGVRPVLPPEIPKNRRLFSDSSRVMAERFQADLLSAPGTE